MTDTLTTLTLLEAFQADRVIYFLDIIGVSACAVAGTLLAKKKGLDITGCIFVGAINAIGGGTVRDLLLNRHPIFWMTDFNYLAIIGVVSIATQVFFHVAHKIDDWLTIFDAIGLSAFTLIGLKVGLALTGSPTIAIIMAATTAVFGGLLRDIICNEIPLMLRREIYITASVSGAGVYLLLHALPSTYGLANWLIDFVSLGLIFTIRMIAVYYDWHLPNISLQRFR